MVARHLLHHGKHILSLLLGHGFIDQDGQRFFIGMDVRWQPQRRAQEAVDVLLSLENEPVLVNGWIDKHMNPELVNRMKQTIRARRKRHFNAEHQHTRKKSIDLEFIVWQRLAGLAQRRGKTLSETIVQLIEDAENKEKYANKMSSLKQDLQALLGKE